MVCGRKGKDYLEELTLRRLHPFQDTNLYTQVPDRMKGTKEEVLLDPDPVLVGISGEKKKRIKN